MRPLFAMALLALPAFAAFPNGYSYCKVVTTQHTMVSGTNDLANYPLTVILTDADLRTTGNGGLVNNSSGYDIGFYPDCSGSGAPLKWEVEAYSPATGAIVAHILRPTLSHSVNDAVGMFYGGSYSSFQSTASSVWNAGYKGVWHLGDGSSLSVADSSGLNSAVNHGAGATAGQVDGAASFASAGSQYVDLGAASAIEVAGPLTVEVWAEFADVSLYKTLIGNLDLSGMGGYELILSTGPKMYLQTSGGGTFHFTGSDSNITPGLWYHIVGTYDGTIGNIYINGLAQSSPFSSAAALPASSKNVSIGRRTDGATDYFNGLMDEVRLSNVARSADWILTEYRNQSAPGTYISAGPRVAAGAGTRIRHLVTGGF
jgi:hypothetical protein